MRAYEPCRRLRVEPSRAHVKADRKATRRLETDAIEESLAAICPNCDGKPYLCEDCWPDTDEYLDVFEADAAARFLEAYDRLLHETTPEPEAYLDEIFFTWLQQNGGRL